LSKTIPLEIDIQIGNKRVRLTAKAELVNLFM